MQTIAQQFREFISRNFLFDRDGGRLSDDDSFLEKGIIDSTGVLELITFIETNFEVKVDDADVIPQNLDSIRNLVRFVERKRKEDGFAGGIVS
jgi:acyl carrier protein